MGWSRRRCQELREAGRVHDIGKACIPQGILQTPGPLSPEDYEIVKGHAALGADVVGAVLSARQANWIRHHHELVVPGTAWGYPDGLMGEEIPEGGLILAIADVWDAMTHRLVCGPGAPSGGRDGGRAVARAGCSSRAGRRRPLSPLLSTDGRASASAAASSPPPSRAPRLRAAPDSG